MRIRKDTPVKVKSYLKSLHPIDCENEHYWKLIGEKGMILEESPNDGSVLVLFKNDISNIGIPNIKENTVWIKKADLELDKHLIYTQKLNEEIVRRTSFMNNTKWFKLFAEIKNQQLFFRSASIKFLLNDNNCSFLLDGFNDKGFEDVGVTGPFFYREIEWIELMQKHEVERWNRKEKLSSEIIVQPLDEVEWIMNTLGQFEYERREDKLIIYGYK